MTVQFDYRAGILEAADPATGREYCWFKGDIEVVISQGGENVGVLPVPAGASVVDAKRVIRESTKEAR